MEEKKPPGEPKRRFPSGIVGLILLILITITVLLVDCVMQGVFR